MMKRACERDKKILSRQEKIFCQLRGEKIKKVKRKFLTLGIYLLG